MDKNVFFRTGFFVLLAFSNNENENYSSIISKRAKLNYSFILKIINEFKNEGIIEKKETKYKKLLILTEKGKKIKKSFEIINKNLNLP